MANRYKRNSQSGSRKSRNSGGSLTGVFILLGVVIGILLTSAGYMFFSKQSSKTKTNSGSLLVKSNEKSAKKEKEEAQRFEFYTLLPGMEVQLPDAPVNTKNQANSNKKHEPVNVLVQPLASRPIPSTAAKESKTQPSSKSADQHNKNNQNTHIQNNQNTHNNQNARSENTNSKVTDSVSIKQAKMDHSTHNSNNTNNANYSNNISNGGSNNASKSTHNASQNSAIQGSAAQYILQAGIFQELNLADELKAKLTLQGFNTRIQKVQTQEGQTWFRVTLGPFASESNALQQKKRLEVQKIHGILILQRPNA